FAHPVLADFVGAIATLRNDQPNSAAIIPAAADPQLSYAQQRQWLMAQLAPESTAYTIPIAVQLEGELSFDGLCQSLDQVVSRHHILRTVYPKDASGQPVPKLLEELIGDASQPGSEWAIIEQVDLSAQDSREQRATVKQHLQTFASQQFDLEQGPLWRAQLLCIGADTHILLFALHHIVADGWSIGVLLKELTTFYQAYRSGQLLTSALPPLDIQYIDYASWQKSLNFDQQLTYWQQQLADAPPLLEFPTDYPRPALSEMPAGTYELRLSKQQTQALRQFSQQHSVTLFMTLLTAFKVLLYRYSGIPDIVVGTPIANRQQAALDDLIGLFVNTLAIRSNLTGNPRLADMLAQVRSTALAAYEHQDLPFEQLLEALDIPRSQSHSPLFQVMFALQNMPMVAVEVDGLRWVSLSTAASTAKFDLTLEMRETDSGLVGVFEYRRDLFSADTMHRMAGHFRTLLKALPEHGQSRLSDLPMLLRQDRQQLQAWRQSAVSETTVTQNSIHQLFEGWAERTPEAIALVKSEAKGEAWGDANGKAENDAENKIEITYQALNQRANQLAHYLRQRGVTPGTRVGIWAERSPQIIVAILAILKAGGTYVPLEPRYPKARLDWIVRDTQMTLLLAGLETSGTDSVRGTVGDAIEEIVELDAIAPLLQQYPTTNLLSETEPDHLAYILYTSGSTGQPKGVCTPHRGVTRLIVQPNYVTLGPEAVILQAAPLGFDASTFELWGALLNGGKLVLLPMQMPSLAELAQAIRRHRVTTLWLTAGLFNLMVDEHLDDLKLVKQLLAGGDVLSPQHLQKALKTLEDTRIINGYGPTEATTFTCCHRISLEELTDSVPIGRPINQTQIYVLDADLQQVPPGLPGELYIGGSGLALGYLNRSELTAERFIPNPFYDIRQVGSDQFYLYRTGDRVRYRADGALEYLGRLDQQVKVRGFRIELGEIEGVLAQHPDIQQAVVVVDGDTADQKRLVAYVQPVVQDLQETDLPEPASNQQTTDATSLRQFLLTRLPDYMLPAQFIWLVDLPLTPNGKVDRRALPAPQWDSQHHAAPQSDIEQQLVTIWSQALRVEAVGIHNNFFDLGGDSIVALQIVSRAAQAGLHFSPQQLFQHQTIAQLAPVVDHNGGNRAAQTPATGTVPLTPIQHWFFEQQLARPAHFNQSVYLALPPETDWTALSQAVAVVCNSHDALRLRFTQTTQGWQQHYGDISAKLQMFDLAHLFAAEQKAEISRLAQQLQESLSLEQGPLVRVAGFKLGTADRLLIVAHHLVVDGVSWRILLADLQQTYQQLLAGESQVTLFRSHSYQQWATQLVEQAKGAAIAADIPYWQSVAQSPSPLPLDITDTTGENTVANTADVTVSLSTAETQRILQTVLSTFQVQIADVLVTALVQTLLAWTQQSAVLIDLENYGRFSETLDLSRTVGWFTGLYPVHLSVASTATLPEQLR
ncbi:MAG: amino acid adenylation domain-containing protein, partial [Cyanobacteria bacterium J06632_22]